jgi:hypothetical protein
MKPMDQFLRDAAPAGYLGLKEAEAGLDPASGNDKTVVVLRSDVAAVAIPMLLELESATAKWPPMNSAHEGWGVIYEEFIIELGEHVWMKQSKRDLPAMRKEALQVAAMALRFALDVCDETRGRK